MEGRALNFEGDDPSQICQEVHFRLGIANFAPKSMLLPHMSDTLQTSKAKYNSVFTVHQTSATKDYILPLKEAGLIGCLFTIEAYEHSVQVEEVTLEGRPSVREVHLQDGGFGPAEEASVQVIMMGHTTLNVFTTTQIYKYTNNTHKYRNTQRKEMSHYSQCNVSQLSLHHTSM